jgi:meso-butanediol dehydrogenase / (S,S)-butanediol dehydrogenase / diacetyl reductase
MRGLTDKVVLVTGGGSGIGAASARRFAAEGARVVVADLNGDAATDVAREIVGHAMHGDIADAGDAERMVQETVGRFGRLDVLHNNAASGAAGRIADIDPASWSRTIAVNLTGHFLMTRAALPAMVDRGGGVVVNMATAAAVLVEEGIGAYAAAKAGVIALTRQTAVEYGRHGIRANCICPGAVATPPTLAFINAVDGVRARMEAANPLRRIAEPDELASVVVFLASDESTFVNGATIMVDGGATADNTVGLMGG